MLTNRRAFLRLGALAGAACATGPWVALDALTRAAGAEEGPESERPAPEGPAPEGVDGVPSYGPLYRAGPDLDLPSGFSYVRFSATGEGMEGGKVPIAHDGMAAFNGPNGTIRLVRNHEVDGPGHPFGPKPYDGRGRGGTMTLVFDPGPGRLVRHFASLTGTVRNCAGGPTPWGTWLSCEETTDGTVHGYEQPHGFVFEVPAGANGVVDTEPLRRMGRFAHEAVCVDPKSGIVYLTEDRNAAGLYRFVPDSWGKLRSGRLQMLGIAGKPGYDTRKGQSVGQAHAARWVDIGQPDPPDAGRNPGAVYQQGHQGGGATFARLEGCAWHNGSAVIVSTSGGNAGLGQIWDYRPGPNTLTLRYESGSAKALRNPDNVTPTPVGGLLLCEDGTGPDRLRFLTPTGHVTDFARNRLGDGEFAGACFSPDGKILFVNVQRPGVTYAITGPWAKAL